MIVLDFNDNVILFRCHRAQMSSELGELYWPEDDSVIGN